MFEPVFSITSKIANYLIKIGILKQEIQDLPITPTVLASLRESARLRTMHYSTYIEGNKLTLEQVEGIIQKGKKFPEFKRDEAEILGYYEALKYIKSISSIYKKITEEDIKNIHALIMAGGKSKVKPTPYRTGQNAIYEGYSKKIVYLPPEAKDVENLMKELVKWLNKSEQEALPCPLRAAIAHYQFVTIHPYYDGNGRTARLLATVMLHRGGYDLKGLYSLDEYYAKNLPAYYNALSVGNSHNYYLGRAQADITNWLSYFCQGMLDSFEKVKTHALLEYHKGTEDKSKFLRDFDPKQQAILSFFKKNKVISSKNIQEFFNLSSRSARALCLQWVKENFLVVKNPAKKNRLYDLNPEINKKFFS